MKKRLLFLTAAASVALVGCTNDNFVGITDIETPEEQVAIDFGSNTQAKTRADHATSAELLGGKFYIYGQKTTAGTTSTIFDNYLLEYAEGTAGSTESNTADWEYVGKNSLKGAYQDIKYWDYSASEYNFVAVSGLGANKTIKNTVHINSRTLQQRNDLRAIDPDESVYHLTIIDDACGCKLR